MLNPDARNVGTERALVGEPAPAVLDDLAAAVWVQAYDAAWLGRNWPELERQLAADVALLSPGLQISVAGRRAVLAHMRTALRDAQVHEYNATDLKGRSSGGIGIISYRWQLDWTVGHHREQLSGRDVLVLCASPAGWQLLRRLPLDT
ncbi:MAG TPA: nuclear transport factor 2 family protein [Steroidobacteraceae bacterium]|jgi:hypothetical protein|nr:nuclear transport factor 2 family protein [Steroidobacteraceae bacterium]